MDIGVDAGSVTKVDEVLGCEIAPAPRANGEPPSPPTAVPNASMPTRSAANVLVSAVARVSWRWRRTPVPTMATRSATRLGVAIPVVSARVTVALPRWISRFGDGGDADRREALVVWSAECARDDGVNGSLICYLDDLPAPAIDWATERCTLAWGVDLGCRNGNGPWSALPWMRRKLPPRCRVHRVGPSFARGRSGRGRKSAPLIRGRLEGRRLGSRWIRAVPNSLDA